MKWEVRYIRKSTDKSDTCYVPGRLADTAREAMEIVRANYHDVYNVVDAWKINDFDEEGEA